MKALLVHGRDGGKEKAGKHGAKGHTKPTPAPRVGAAGKFLPGDSMLQKPSERLTWNLNCTGYWVRRTPTVLMKAPTTRNTQTSPQKDDPA